jgi:hypothetical protein
MERVYNPIRTPRHSTCKQADLHDMNTPNAGKGKLDSRLPDSYPTIQPSTTQSKPKQTQHTPPPQFSILIDHPTSTRKEKQMQIPSPSFLPYAGQAQNRRRTGPALHSSEREKKSQAGGSPPNEMYHDRTHEYVHRSRNILHTSMPTRQCSIVLCVYA